MRLEPLLAVAFEQASAGLRYKHAPTAVNGLGPGLGGARLVFVSGRFAPRFPRVEGLPTGATVTNLASVLAQGGERLEPVFSHTFAPFCHAFVALNTALGADGAFVSLAAAMWSSRPRSSLCSSRKPTARRSVSCPRSVVLAAPGSQADDRRNPHRPPGRGLLHERRHRGHPRKQAPMSRTTRSRTRRAQRSTSRCSTSDRVARASFSSHMFASGRTSHATR